MKGGGELEKSQIYLYNDLYQHSEIFINIQNLHDPKTFEI